MWSTSPAGHAIYLRMVGYRPGLPYVKHQKRVTSSSNVVARAHVGDSASAPRQTCPALLCAPAMAVAIKSDNAKTQLPPKRHRRVTFSSFFRMSSILKVQNILLHRNVSAIMLKRCYVQNTIAHYHLNSFFWRIRFPVAYIKHEGIFQWPIRREHVRFHLGSLS